MRTRWLLASALVTGAVALTGCLGGGSGGTGPSGFTTELEGTWVYTESDTNYTYSLTWAFTDSNWTRTDELVTDQTYTWQGTFDLNTGASPKTVDFYCTSSPDSTQIGQTALGIYSLNSTATACTIAVNDFGDTVRPTDFYYGWVLNKQ